jgi:hypothetical protein
MESAPARAILSYTPMLVTGPFLPVATVVIVITRPFFDTTRRLVAITCRLRR